MANRLSFFILLAVLSCSVFVTMHSFMGDERHKGGGETGTGWHHRSRSPSIAGTSVPSASSAASETATPTKSVPMTASSESASRSAPGNIVHKPSLRAVAKTAAAEQAASGKTAVKLSIPEDMLDCETYEVIVSLQSGRLSDDAHLEITGRKPDMVFYAPGGREDHLWHEWAPVTCMDSHLKTTLDVCKRNWKTEAPPDEFKFYVPLVANGSTVYVARFSPDPSALEYEFAVGGAVDHLDSVVARTVRRNASTSERSCPSSMECHPVHNHGVPGPTAFGLYPVDSDVPLRCDETITVAAGTTKQLILRPLPATRRFYEKIVPETFWAGVLHSKKFVQPVDVAERYDASAGGWPVSITSRDPGEYHMNIILSWFYGRSEFAEPQPFVVGGHMQHERSECELTRAAAFGCLFRVVVTGAPHDPVVGPKAQSKRCLEADAPGRWVEVPLPDCALPFCSGDRANTKVQSSYTGAKTGLVYAPYSCHYHLFTTADIDKCAAETAMQWVHVYGDSTSREFPGALYDQYGFTVFGRFEEHDKTLGKAPFRVTFQFPRHLYADRTNTPRDFVKEDRPLFDIYNLTCQGDNVICPNVLILNPAMCYTTWRQSLKSYEDWIKDMVAYVKEVKAAPLGNRRKPLRVIWYRPPFLWSQAHSHSSPFITAERIIAFDDASLPLLREAGVEIFDAKEVTRSRPDDSWDGTHYLSMAMEAHGAVSNMMVSIILNSVFRDCNID